MNKSEYFGPVKEIIQNNFYASASIDSILEDWTKNKSELYKRFGNKTIVKSSELITIATNNEHEVRDSFKEFLLGSQDLIGDKRFLEEFNNFYAYAVGTNGFRDNEVCEDWSIGVVEDGSKEVKIPAGMKFSRTLKHFYDTKTEEGRQNLDKQQILYSRYRQTFSSERKGKLFLSIDPYDFLTISDNNHNWSSCHNLGGGEHRSGNINYMADAVTAVAYYGDDDFEQELDVFNTTKKWNSKRWRVLVHMEVIDGNLMVMYNQQYPFASTKLLKELDKMILDLYSDTKPSKLKEYNRPLPPVREIAQRGNATCHYLDFRYDNECFLRISEEYLENEDKIRPMSIGHSFYCLECDGDYATDSNEGICDLCSDELYCENCGDYYSEDNMEYMPNYGYICADCYDESCVCCEECSEVVFHDYAHYNEFFDEYWCEDCYSRLQDTSTTFIFMVSDAFKQKKNGELEEAVIKDYYKKLNAKTRKIRDIEDMEGHYTYVEILLLDDGRKPWGMEPDVQNEIFELRDFQRELITVNRDCCNRVSLGHRDGLAKIENWQEEMSNIDKIVILGSADSTTRAAYITKLESILQRLQNDDIVLDHSNFITLEKEV